MHKNDLLALLSCVAGVGSLATDVAFGSDLNKALGPHAAAVLAGIGATGLIANQLIRVLNAPAHSGVQPTQGNNNA